MQRPSQHFFHDLLYAVFYRLASSLSRLRTAFSGGSCRHTFEPLHLDCHSLTTTLLLTHPALSARWYKSLQQQDPHSPEYVTRLKDEVPLINLMQARPHTYIECRLSFENSPAAEETTAPYAQGLSGGGSVRLSLAA
eukprot:363695-Pleurochrysis_carterae.AAC.4